MNHLTTKQQSFIEQMVSDEELSRHGFRLLLERADRFTFFGPLKEAGLFNPQRNPAPIPAPEEGYVRIPYWSALDYLVAAAKFSGEQGDLELANAVMSIVREVSEWNDANGSLRGNYHTAHKFAQILGLVPTSVVSRADLNFLGDWLRNRFERMLISNAMDEIVIPRFLSSADPHDWLKAVDVLKHCTAVEWEDASGLRSAKTVVEPFWLGELINHHAKTFGSKIGNAAAGVFIERIREVFCSEIHKEHSSIYRAAIEDHDQNHQFREAENLLVEGLRDVLCGWVERNETGAVEYVKALVSDELEILRRIAIYIINKHWSRLRSLYSFIVEQDPFRMGHLHELYGLLKAHFKDLNAEDQERTIAAIRTISAPNTDGDAEQARKKIQQTWLSGMVGQNSATVDKWFADLSADPAVGNLSEHPDFSSYMSVSVGREESPYSISELIGFASAKILVQQLQAFKPTNEWRKPSLEGLSSNLSGAVQSTPQAFFDVLPDLLLAKPIFQYSVIKGLNAALTSTEGSANTDWRAGWGDTVTFLESLLGQPAFWHGEDNLHRDWTISAIADLLRDSCQNQSLACESSFLPRVQRLIEILLQQTNLTLELSGDMMTSALNSPRGRIIRTLFSHALHSCRLSDDNTKTHNDVWKQIEPLFESEIARCRNANYEFSTLCGANIAQLDYLSPQWTSNHIMQIFPKSFEANEKCAIAGLAYASFSRQVYQYLLDGEVIERALCYELPSRETREKLVERIVVAYIWEMETLNSLRFDRLFTIECVSDLEHAAWTLWTFRKQELTSIQKDLIIAFWKRCSELSRRLKVPHPKLLAALGLLACYLPDAKDSHRELLIAVAPYVHIGHHTYVFIDELQRMAVSSPEGVCAVLDEMVKSHVPDYDYKDQLKVLLRTLIELGQRLKVIPLLERLKSLPGMQALFQEVVADASSEN